MFSKTLNCLLLAQAALTAAIPTPNLLNTFAPLFGPLDPGHLDGPSKRPIITFEPHHPSKGGPPSPPRTKVCTVKTHNDLVTDDSEFILEALHECNDGGHVVFSQGKSFVIGTALDMTFLKHIDIDIQGYVQFTNNTDYWQANAFPQVFQNVTTFFQLGGEDVNVFGGGTLDGNGQIWYDLFAQNEFILRPVLFGTIGLHGGSISNLNFINSPEYYNFVANSTDVVFSNIFITGFSNSSNVAKNTDGWDTYRSDSITIQNSTINNGDDCVSFKPNSTNILVQNLHCNGSHGISVGSLGQFVGTVDIVENVYVYNIFMANASDGARVKVWPGVASGSGDLTGGGGTGAVSNITYDTMHVTNVDFAIEITQCYEQTNITLCNEFPSSLTMNGLLFKNFFGTTSKTNEPFVGTLVCSSPDVCSDITAENINVLSPIGTNLYTCLDVDPNTLAINCTTAMA